MSNKQLKKIIVLISVLVVFIVGIILVIANYDKISLMNLMGNSTVQYTCPTGFVLKGTNCEKTETIAASLKMTCRNDSTYNATGYVYNVNSKKCEKTQTISATQRLQCPTGYNYNTSTRRCEKKVYTDTIKKRGSCPSGYHYNPSNNQCEKKMYEKAKKKESCPYGYIKKSNQCIKEQKAEKKYICLAGYKLRKTRCEKSVSIKYKKKPLSSSCPKGSEFIVGQWDDFCSLSKCPKSAEVIANKCYLNHRYIDISSNLGKYDFINDWTVVNVVRKDKRTIKVIIRNLKKSWTAPTFVNVSCSDNEKLYFTSHPLTHGIRVMCYTNIKYPKRPAKTIKEDDSNFYIKATCPTGYKNLGGDWTNPICIKESCPSGYTKEDSSTCIKKQKAKQQYTCPTGYILNTKTNMCESKKHRKIEITYTCSKGYSYNKKSGKCEKVLMKKFKGSISCPTGYTYRSASKCEKIEISTPASNNVSYSCPTGYILNGTTCSKTIQKQPISTYYCPSGYQLYNKKCIKKIVQSATKIGSKPYKSTTPTRPYQNSQSMTKPYTNSTTKKPYQNSQPTTNPYQNSQSTSKPYTSARIY